MGKATSSALRALIIEARERGKSLRALSVEYELSYATVQNLCSRYVQQGQAGLLPLYGNCGKRARNPREDVVYRAVRCFKCWHPGWGAEKIRTELISLNPALVIPPARTLQHWFVSNGQNPKRVNRPQTEKQWGKAEHDVWQIDAKEEMQTLDGQKNCWLNIKDEYSGAIIEPRVFPLQENL